MKIFFILLFRLYITMFIFSADCFISVDNLLLIIVLFIIYNFYTLVDFSKSNFLLKKKNEIYKDYYVKLFNLYFFLDTYKKFLKKKINNINFLINLLKFIGDLIKKSLYKKIENFKNIIIYLYNNYLNNYYINNIIYKKLIINFLFNLKFKKYYFLKYYNTILKKIN